MNEPTNQIVKIQTSKKLIAFYDKLKTVESTNYAQLHAKGEKDSSGIKHSSLIGITIQDYSNGTGQNNVIAQFNLEPEQIQYLLTRVEWGIQDFEWPSDKSDKIFGDPDKSGMSTAQRLQITRHSFRQDGTLINNPWFVAISNGRGIRVKSKTGGYYMKGGSYIQDKYVFINLSDMDMYKLLKRVDTYIRMWEIFVPARNIVSGRRQVAEYIRNYKPNNQWSNGYSRNKHRDYQNQQSDYQINQNDYQDQQNNYQMQNDYQTQQNDYQTQQNDYQTQPNDYQNYQYNYHRDYGNSSRAYYN